MAYHCITIPEEYIELQKEVHLNPDMPKVLENTTDDFEVKLAAIAAYCGIILDGAYDQHDMCVISKKCTQILRDKREGNRIILLNS